MTNLDNNIGTMEIFLFFSFSFFFMSQVNDDGNKQMIPIRKVFSKIIQGSKLLNKNYTVTIQ